MTEREDLKHRIDVVLQDLMTDMEAWRQDGLIPNSTLAEAKELHEEATWERQPDLAGQLTAAIERAEQEIERGRS